MTLNPKVSQAKILLFGPMIIDMEGECELQKVNIGASPKLNQCTYKSVEKISSPEGFFFTHPGQKVTR